MACVSGECASNGVPNGDPGSTITREANIPRAALQHSCFLGFEA
jgi:hypothetical protein